MSRAEIAAAVPRSAVVDDLRRRDDALGQRAEPVTILNVDPVGVAAAIARL